MVGVSIIAVVGRGDTTLQIRHTGLERGNRDPENFAGMEESDHVFLALKYLLLSSYIQRSYLSGNTTRIR